MSCAIRRMLVGAIRTTGSDDRKELLLQFPCPSCLYMNKTFAKFEFASNATVSNFCSRPLVEVKAWLSFRVFRLISLHRVTRKKLKSNSVLGLAVPPTLLAQLLMPEQSHPVGPKYTTL